jgi:hypothetical protein
LTPKIVGRAGFRVFKANVGSLAHFNSLRFIYSDTRTARREPRL